MEKITAQLNRTWSFIEHWLDRERIRFLCLGLLSVTMLLVVISFVTSDENHQTRFGSLGEDFAGFYYAGKILNGPTPDQLYDPATQDEAYYEIFPSLRPTEEHPGGKNLPYVHPPIVAFCFRPFARLPYPTAYATWLILSAALYISGLAITCRVLTSMPRTDRNLAMLLALVFEPFLMECWLGGQLSAIAFLCMALAFYWEDAQKPIWSGLALGLCLYKPTLVVLLLPMLAVARRWWTLLGVGLTGLALALVSLLAVGSRICLSYIDALRGFTGTATGAGMVRKDWKFIDLNFFFRNLFGEPTPLGKVLVLMLAAGPLIFLMISWWKLGGMLSRPSGVRSLGHRESNGRESMAPYCRLLWASTVTWTMVINVYMGIYDMVLVILALLWTADVFYRQANRLETFFPTFKLLVFLVFVLAWFTQPLARQTGFQVITPVLFALAAFQLRLAWKTITYRAAAQGLG
jgi:hypothetical protein